MQHIVAYIVIFAGIWALTVGCAPAENPNKWMPTGLSHTIENEILKNEYRPQSPERKKALANLVSYIQNKKAAGDTAKLVFICTHNSRRSHMSQIWAQTAARYYQLTGIECYSGGTEATAFNPNAIKALQAAGFDISASEPNAPNPKYAVMAGEWNIAIAFSKKFENAPNPTGNFAAVMTCAHADANCPYVPGAAARIALPYQDPKAADGTGKEDSTYQARSLQIAREMFYIFNQIKK